VNAADVMAATVADLVAAIEAGAGEWRMPWTHDGTSGLPHNTVTGQPYRGGNVLALWAASALQGWGHEWATFKQWQTLGATVRKGERGTHCIYWNVKPAETTTDVDPDTGDEVTLTTGPRVRWARAFVVFNASQVDGYTAIEPVTVQPEPGCRGGLVRPHPCPRGVGRREPVLHPVAGPGVDARGRGVHHRDRTVGHPRPRTCSLDRSRRSARACLRQAVRRRRLRRRGTRRRAFGSVHVCDTRHRDPAPRGPRPVPGSLVPSPQG